MLRRFTAAIAALGFTGAAVAGVLATGAGVAQADGSRAVVVVDTGSGVHRSVISFSGTITGLQALQLAGANPVTLGYAGQGTAICALDGVGHDATQSSCLGTLADPRYWAYFRSPAGSGGWAYSRGCACTSSVHDGDVEGWKFGTGQSPPYSSFCAVAGCAPPPTVAPPPTAAPPPPSVQGTIVVSPQGGSTGTGSGPGATKAGGSPVTTGAGGTATTGGGPSASDPSPSTGPGGADATGGGSKSRGTKSDERASAATRGGSGGDAGGGSPWGVIGAVVLVAGLAGGGWWLRRRRVAVPPAP